MSGISMASLWGLPELNFPRQLEGALGQKDAHDAKCSFEMLEGSLIK